MMRHRIERCDKQRKLVTKCSRNPWVIWHVDTRELTVSLGGVGVDPLVFELVSSKRKF